MRNLYALKFHRFWSGHCYYSTGVYYLYALKLFNRVDLQKNREVLFCGDTHFFFYIYIRVKSKLYISVEDWTLPIHKWLYKGFYWCMCLQKNRCVCITTIKETSVALFCFTTSGVVWSLPQACARTFSHTLCSLFLIIEWDPLKICFFPSLFFLKFPLLSLIFHLFFSLFIFFFLLAIHF